MSWEISDKRNEAGFKKRRVRQLKERSGLGRFSTWNNNAKGDLHGINPKMTV